MTCALLLACAAAAGADRAERAADAASRALARDIYKELIEIDTSTSSGNTTRAAEAMARRLRAAGFAAGDVLLVGDDPNKQNLVARLRGTGRARPVLLMGHLDVVDARREDWHTDPFKLVVADGFYYGRGTQDMKDGDAIMVATLIRLKREEFSSPRDVILALTADEEASGANGIDWLVRHRRDLIDAEFAINHDGTGVDTDHGRPVAIDITLGEKVYADFELTARSKGGHSSEPTADNAIYALAGALERLGRYHFPFELNDAVRASYEQRLAGASPERAAMLRGVLDMPPRPAAVARFDLDPGDYAQAHTTCVATRLAAGHANNALAQTATAIVNCRILPGHEPEEVRQELVQVLAEPRLEVAYIDDFGVRRPTAESKHGFPAPVVRAELVRAVKRAAADLWPGTPVVPIMTASASDAAMLAPTGIPVYGVSGDAADLDDHRRHGQDERLSVEAFDHGVDFFYRFLATLLGGGP